MKTAVTIGQMRHSANFAENNPSLLGAGQVDNTTSLVAVRGRLRKLSGSYAESMALVSGQDSYEFICRFQSTLAAGLKARMKVIIDNETYTIDTWELVDEIKHFYKFKLNKQVVS